ncbi:hypothetical protein MIMGU_mgv1a020317mg, partial [Erythranthe guttata]
HVYVSVYNNLPENTPPMLLHCQSKNDRLGYHTLAKGENFDFDFCPVWRTLFFCHVWWNGKDIAFDVYSYIVHCLIVRHRRIASYPYFTKYTKTAFIWKDRKVETSSLLTKKAEKAYEIIHA